MRIESYGGASAPPSPVVDGRDEDRLRARAEHAGPATVAPMLQSHALNWRQREVAPPWQPAPAVQLYRSPVPAPQPQPQPLTAAAACPAVAPVQPPKHKGHGFGFSLPGLGTVVHIVDRGRDFVDQRYQEATAVVDRVKDAAFDAADTGRRMLHSAVDDLDRAAQRGADVARSAWSIARSLGSPQAFDHKLNQLTAPVDSLKPGDSVVFDAGLEVSAEAAVGVQGQVEVQRNGDGSYTVSGQADATLGLKVTKTGIDFSAGARVEFQADTPEEAREMAVSLLKAGTVTAVQGAAQSQGAGWLAPLAGRYGPSKQELDQLGDHLSAVEVHGAAAVGAGAEIGLSDELDSGASGNLEGEVALRVEFDEGRPQAVVMRSTVQADGEAGDSLSAWMPQDAVEPLADAVGMDPQALLEGGDATLRVTVETRAEFEQPPAGPQAPAAQSQAAAVLGGGPVPGLPKLPKLPLAGEPQTTVTLSADVAAADSGEGLHGELSFEGVSPGEAAEMARDLAEGDVRAAAKDVEVEGRYEFHSTQTDTQGPDINVVVAGAHATRTVTHTGVPHTGGVAVSDGVLTHWSQHNPIEVVQVGDPSLASLPYGPQFGPLPAGRPGGPIPKEYELIVGNELGRGLGLSDGQVRALKKNQPLPDETTGTAPILLKEPRIFLDGNNGAGDKLNRMPDWVVIQQAPSGQPQPPVLVVEATLDSRFTVNADGSAFAKGHKPLQVTGTIDALVRTFGEDRPITYVIRSPREPSGQAKDDLAIIQDDLSTKRQYRNVTVIWVAG